MRFSHRFFSGSGLVLERFWDGFWEEKCSKFVKTHFSRNPWKYWFSLRKIDIFKVSRLWVLQGLLKKALKSYMFFGTSIWKGFGVGFGRFLGGQNHRFSYFFRCFFEANFEQHFRRPKNRKKNGPRGRIPLFWGRRRGMRCLLGREKERGQEASGLRVLGRSLKIA